jgi:hypothetical protein
VTMAVLPAIEKDITTPENQTDWKRLSDISAWGESHEKS